MFQWYDIFSVIVPVIYLFEAQTGKPVGSGEPIQHRVSDIRQDFSTSTTGIFNIYFYPNEKQAHQMITW